jgi:hypothetical protein
MILIKRESSSHWYLRDGTPFHETERADGKGLRSVTLRDARKVRAFPSVTNILGILAKPALDAWKQEQAILAALTLPRSEDEPLDAFAKRVVTDMSAQVEKAADLGSAIHAACEVYATSKALPENPEVAALFAPVREWFDADVERIDCIERVVTHSEWGYGGRVDMVCKLKSTGSWAVVDFKTQKVKRDAKGALKPTFYEAWPLQLEAYRQAILVEAARKQPLDIVSLVISSIEPVPVMPKVWPREEQTAYYRAFLNARNLWVWMKGYCPIEGDEPGAGPMPAPLNPQPIKPNDTAKSLPAAY